MDAANRQRRRRRIRSRVQGTAQRPRAVVWRSNRSIGVQVIDDDKQATLLAVQSNTLDGEGSKMERATLTGKTAAAKAGELGITQVVFDRGGYRYHGRIKALAEAMREGGLDF